MTAATAMTKDELKAALGTVGVDPAGKAKKDELVALYEEHVASLPVTPAGEKADVVDDEDGLTGGGDFSCDDEEEIALANLKKSGQKGGGLKTSKISSDSVKSSPVKADTENGDADVIRMTDDQLSESLIERGIEVGPIVGSTRKLYQRKLMAAIRNESMNGGGGLENGADSLNGNGHLKDGEFSADDEEIDTSKVTTNGDSSNHEEVTQPQEDKKSETSEDSEDPQPSMVAKKTTPTIRQRFIGLSGADATDSKATSGERFTPTPRRSIHTYKVTEKSTESLVKNKDGTVNYDFDYTKVTSQQSNHLTTQRPRLATLLRILPGFFLILLGFVLAYYVYTKRK